MTNLPTVAILAGGRGTRLMPLTADRPKCLVEVAGRPFIEWQLERLRDGGITDVVLCVGYRGDMVQQAVGDGKRFGLRVRYSFDGERPLGTGGAIRKALPLLGDAFFVLYGDSLLDVDYEVVYQSLLESDMPALMTVCRAGTHDTPNADYADGCVRRYDKSKPTGEYMDYGLGMLLRFVFNNIGSFDLGLVYQFLAKKWLAGYEVATRFHEIGSPEGLAETRAYLEGIQSR